MGKERTVTVVKSDGREENYSRDKLKRSLRNVNTSDTLAAKIISHVENSLYNRISTQEIFNIVRGGLQKYSAHSHGRYNLKKAIMELGNTGFPFEQFIAEIYIHRGYTVEVGRIFQGRCVSHEIDIYAWETRCLIFCECKFHQSQGTICGVKIPLYIHSRFRDIESNIIEKEEIGNPEFGWYIYNNTRFSKDAIQYAECAGINLISWSYPAKNSLKKTIDRLGIHPVTCLFTLTTREKHALIKKGVILCNNLASNPNVLEEVVRDKSKISIVLNECEAICTRLEGENES